MRVLENAADLEESLDVARREAAAAFGNDEVYVEKLVRHARHVEVQVLGDSAGNLVHLFERDCSVQRRNQKVVERAPASYLSDSQRETLCGLALRLAAAANYVNAGTVEFLMDVDSGEFFFIEVNPRIQVEHTVTEEITGQNRVELQAELEPGFYIVRIKSLPGSPRGTFLMSLITNFVDRAGGDGRVVAQHARARGSPAVAPPARGDTAG